MRIKEITNYLEEVAPLYYQEEYDNSGLLVGDSNTQIKNVIITLDCTEEVVDEAISKDCNLIIAHHPIIFKGLKKLNGSNYIQRIIIKAIKNDIAIYAMHTNLDNIYNGVNYYIANKIKLDNCKVLAPKSDLLRQLVVYCPKQQAAELKEALFRAGAGNIGNYEGCSFTSIGKGTFKATERATPFVGEVNEFHTEHEDRIEVIYARNKEKHILEAMQTTHPYEEVSYQIYVIENKHRMVGAGIVGELENSMKSAEFLDYIKEVMKTDCIRHTSLVKKRIKKVAICGGSGSFLLSEAIASGAEIFITADFKYHDFFNADNNIIIADIGHYESEQYTKDLIYDLLVKKFTKFAVQLSKVNTNPINYL